MFSILVVEDDPDQLENLEWAAQGPGIEVVTVPAAEDAIEKIKERDFDVVVTDVMMETQAAGLRVLKAAQERNKNTQVILCTAYGTPQFSIEAMRMGAFDYLERNTPGIDFLGMVRSKIRLAQQFRDGRLSSQGERILGQPRRNEKWPEVFVLMPFAPNLKPIFEDLIRKVVSGAGLTVGRADDFFRPRVIVNDIWSAINAARIIIADCTGRNPNVFYEIGLAHATGKETILLTQSLEDVPFDLRSLRVIVYEYSAPGVAKFEQELSKALADSRSSNS